VRRRREKGPKRRREKSVNKTGFSSSPTKRSKAERMKNKGETSFIIEDMMD